MEKAVILESMADVAILIVGFRNAEDIRDCLVALSGATGHPEFNVFICENGGRSAFHRLVERLCDTEGPCTDATKVDVQADVGLGRCSEVQRLRLRTSPSNVWVACAAGNLGYAGGINLWLDRLQDVSGWNGIWVLNPDTLPETGALAALVERAASGNKGMVGSTIVDVDGTATVRCRGGLHWQKWLTRPVAIGRGEQLNSPHDVRAIEAAMDCPSGASMYVTRDCIEKIGPMDESYFLFSEDLDWGVRAKPCGLGYAAASIVRHKRGTTTGSARDISAVPRFSVYLQHRNAVRFVRKHFPMALPFCAVVMVLYAVRYFVKGAWQNCIAGLHGTFAGLRGEMGPPICYPEISELAESRGGVLP
ncbi:glycosyltransferase family 2 protein [Bradyrhizobium japonicum]|uniref:glycosyltransferase family 2 protein n=1 Tax=Bradyrhizobium sp. DN5 TaxID=3056950 RepID=UPI0035256D0D